MGEIMSKELFLKLYKAERESEIDEIIIKNNMTDLKNWVPYGNNTSNFSVIGNQSSNAERALIEKITNSVDAVLTRRSYENDIDPKDDTSPQSPKDALEKFFKIQDGNTSNITKEEEKLISENIILMATNKECEPTKRGSRIHPNLIIYDNGEGQTPEKLPDTILSLLKGNKASINFTQGNYNQGGSGALMYCGDSGYCLVISKRHVKISESFIDKNDKTYTKWGWTLIRKEIREGYKDPVYTYYAPKGKVPCFESDELELLPEELGSKESKEYIGYTGSCKAYIPYKKKVQCGTAIKLFNYQVKKKGALNSHIKYDLAAFIYDTYLPIKFLDCRKNSGSNTYIFRGFKKIIEEDMKQHEESEKGLIYQKLNFDFEVDKQQVEVTIYCCNKKKKSDLTAEKLIEGSRPIKFCLGQQFQGGLTSRFLNAAGLGTIQDLLILIVQFPNIKTQFRADLFMTDRERLYDKRPKKEIDKKLKDYFKESEELREFKNYIMKSVIATEKKDNASVKDAIENLLEKDPAMKKVLLGIDIPKDGAENSIGKGNDKGETKPKKRKKSKSGNSKETKVIETKFIPTYFEPLLKRDEDDNYFKPCYVDKQFRIRFETDAEDNFFNRSKDSGKVKVSIDGKETDDFGKSFSNGICSLIFNKRVSGKKVGIKVITVNLFCGEDLIFTNAIKLILSEQPKKSETKDKGKDNGGVGLPKFELIKEDNWDIFSMNEESSVVLRSDNDAGVIRDIYYINMDNKYLEEKRQELKNEQALIELYEQLYIYNMLFVAMSTKNSEIAASSNKVDDNYSIEKELEIATRAYARVFFITEQLTSEMKKKIGK